MGRTGRWHAVAVRRSRPHPDSKLPRVSLADELERIADAARGYTAEGETLAAVIPAEPAIGTVLYLCAFTSGAERSWLALDVDGQPVSDRGLVHDAVSIAALCELAEESAGGGRLEDLRLQLGELDRVEGTELVADATDALTGLERALGESPRVASPAYLDGIGAATRNLEQALGELAASPFAEAMKQGSVAVDGLTMEVEGGYKLPLH
jgi:hypothetical protein